MIDTLSDLAFLGVIPVALAYLRLQWKQHKEIKKQTKILNDIYMEL